MNERLTIQALADQRIRNVELLRQIQDMRKTIDELTLEKQSVTNDLMMAALCVEEFKEMGLLAHLRYWWKYKK